MNDHPDLFPFPDITDEAVIAVNDFLETFHTHFQHHYFAQMHRYYPDLPDGCGLHLIFSMIPD